MKYRELKVGDTFVYENIILTLKDVLKDKNNELWAIGVDTDGVPCIVDEDGIPDVTETVITVLTLPDPTAKPKATKGKK